MTYDPNIPQAGDNISDSQSDILTNFSQIGSLFGSNAAADHYAFDDATSAYRALHKQVTFPIPLGAAPAVSNPKGIIFPLADVTDTSTRTQVYYKNGSTSHQMTNRFSSAAATGYIMLSGSQDNIILMWGFEGVPGSTTHTISFPAISNYAYGGGQTQGFPNNCFIVTTTVGADDTTTKTCSVKSGSTTKEQFVIKLSSLSINGIYWFAIGN